MYDLDSLIDRDPRIRSLDGMDVKRLISILGRSIEVVGVEHLVTCLLDGTSMGDDGIIRTYVGFEPSGRAHIGWKVLADQISSMLEGGANVLIFMADWHAWVNDKFDGDMAAIQATATYMEATFRALLGHPDEGDGPGALRFESASDLMASPDYWARVLRCSKNMSLARVRKTFSIMGRHEDSSEEDLSKFYYPALQAADIFEMDIDVALGGMDQRKAHMYMRDVADKWGWPKATCLHTPILSSLKASGSRMDSFDHKMSKSDPKGPCSCSTIPLDSGRRCDPPTSTHRIPNPRCMSCWSMWCSLPQERSRSLLIQDSVNPAPWKAWRRSRRRWAPEPFIHSARSSLWQMHSRHSSPPFVRPSSRIPRPWTRSLAGSIEWRIDG